MFNTNKAKGKNEIVHVQCSRKEEKEEKKAKKKEEKEEEEKEVSESRKTREKENAFGNQANVK